jgi:DNA (cytosine-5)-methyltransferase 1
MPSYKDLQKWIGYRLESYRKAVSEWDPEFSQDPHFDAAFTHWLQTKDLRLPFLPEGFPPTYMDEKRLIRGAVRESQLPLLIEGRDIPYPPPRAPKFTFIDLFAGIGGFRQAMQSCGGKCVFTSEWDRHAQSTYFANYGEFPYGDITEIDENWIPDHDVLCAGFPCQPFSLAGVSKKNSMGRKHGFEDETQGTLFFDIARIINAKRPKAFFLENVKNLLRHDGGETFEVIRHALEDELKYVIDWKVVDAANWVPQHRERVFIVGYNPKKVNVTKSDICIPTGPRGNYTYQELKSLIAKEVDPRYTLGPGTWDTLVRHKARHESKGQGFGYGIHRLPVKNGTVTRTISARYHKDGAEILIEQPGKRPRRLTVEEAMQLQGYDPTRFRFPVSNTQAYRQIGNSVAVPAIKATAQEIAKIMRANK